MKNLLIIFLCFLTCNAFAQKQQLIPTPYEFTGKIKFTKPVELPDTITDAPNNSIAAKGGKIFIKDTTWKELTASGAIGTRWLSDAGAPSAGSGKVGDWYVNTTSQEVFEKTDLTTWSPRFTLGGGSVSPILNSSNLASFTGQQRLSADGNTLFDVMDVNTRTYFTASKRTTIGGKAIQDSWIDNVCIWKKGSDYWVRDFEGDVQLRWYVSDTSGATTVGGQVQQAITTAIRMYKSVFVGDKAIYNTTGTTVYFNKEVGQVFNFYGNGQVVKDYQSGKQNMGVVFVKYDSGDMFRVNLKADGSPYANFDSYSLNFSMYGFSMRGAADTANTTAIQTYRTRGAFEHLNFVNLRMGIRQEWVPPAGYAGTWNNYSDQSRYNDLRFFNMVEGLKLTNADGSQMSNWYWEWPKGNSTTAFWIRNSFSFFMFNILHSNGNQVMNITDTSSFIKLEVCRAFGIKGVHAENVQYKNLFKLISPFAWSITDVHTRFKMRTLLSMYQSRAGKFEEYYEWCDTKTDTTDVDFRDEDSTSTDFIWNQLHLRNYTTAAIRTVKLNRSESSSFGTYINRKAVEEYVYDKSTKAVYNYSSSPHYQMNAEWDVVEFPAISQNTTVRLLNPALYPGRRLVLINRNANYDYNTTLQNYLLWFTDSTSTSLLPQNRTIYVQSDSTKWSIISNDEGRFMQKDSVYMMTAYLNVNNNRFPKNGNLMVVADVNANSTLDLPSAAVTKGQTITVVKIGDTSFYVRAKSVVGGQLVQGQSNGDTIRNSGKNPIVTRIYKSDGTNYYNVGGSSGSTVYVGGVGEIDAVPTDGSNNAVSSNGVYDALAEFSSGMANPMTTAGDMIRGGTSGTPQRVGVGSNGQVWKVVSGVPQWGTDETGGGGTGDPSDGDKGDISVNSGTWTIDNSAVTNAKQANMAAKTYKGRTTNSTGAPEDVTVGTLKTDLNLVKADVGLGNVDNTSDATKNSATATLTNKTMSGSNNTFSNIPQSAITGLVAILTSLQENVTISYALWLDGDSLHLDIGGADTAIYIPASSFGNGTFTSVGTNENVASFTTRTYNYERKGSEVKMWGTIQFTPTNGSDAVTYFKFSPPIASAFTTIGQASGSASSIDAANNVRSVVVRSDAATDGIHFQLQAASNSLHTITYTFTYTVLP